MRELGGYLGPTATDRKAALQRSIRNVPEVDYIFWETVNRVSHDIPKQLIRKTLWNPSTPSSAD